MSQGQGFGPPTKGFVVAQPSHTDDSTSTKQPGSRKASRDDASASSASEAPDSQPVRKLEIPPDVEPPTQGWPATVYRRNLAKQKEDPARPGYILVPTPNDKEQAFRTERDYVALLEQSKHNLVGLTKVRQRAIVVFINSKGNGATTTSVVWTSTGLCVETGTEVTVFDANWASGTASQRLRLSRAETVSERLLVDNLGVLSVNHGTFNEYVRSNTDRVRVVAAKSVMQGGGKLSDAEYVQVATLAFDNCDYLYVDTPNDIASEQLLALADIAHVLVFTANVGEQDSLRQLGTSMQALRNHGLEDKVNRSVVLISNLRPGESPNDFRKYQNEVDIENNVVSEFPGHEGPWVGVRHDRAMAEARQVVWADLNRETAQDIRLVNTAIQKRLPDKQTLTELQEGIRISKLTGGNDYLNQEGGVS